mmetsp:Transcript_17386/g.51123  ORF Transcript_17386/g.51123 Transcript_17386/m.51123 type:complete len:295 (-) Transcript_17386:128-1012(-)
MPRRPRDRSTAVSALTATWRPARWHAALAISAARVDDGSVEERKELVFAERRLVGNGGDAENGRRGARRIQHERLAVHIFALAARRRRLCLGFALRGRAAQLEQLGAQPADGPLAGARLRSHRRGGRVRPARMHAQVRRGCAAHVHAAALEPATRRWRRALRGQRAPRHRPARGPVARRADDCPLRGARPAAPARRDRCRPASRLRARALHDACRAATVVVSELTSRTFCRTVGAGVRRLHRCMAVVCDVIDAEKKRRRTELDRLRFNGAKRRRLTRRGKADVTHGSDEGYPQG